jgi:hypothetical protein
MRRSLVSAKAAIALSRALFSRFATLSVVLSKASTETIAKEGDEGVLLVASRYSHSLAEKSKPRCG